MIKRSLFGISGVAAVLLAPLVALTPQPGYAEAIEEIIVSVRRKNESLQEVPLSVSTIGSDQIKRFGINNIGDVIKYSAGLEFDEGLGAQDTRIVIRGLSPTRGRSNVAILVDGVDFTGEAVGTAGGGILVNQQLLDVERVEIVKGPQSALYGRSAFAGAIQYVSKKPSLEEAEGSIDVQLGNGNSANNTRIGAAYGAPITDSFALRVNALTYDQEGFYENSLTGGEIGGSEGYGLALAGVWDRGGIFSANGRVAYSNDKYQPQAQARIYANTLVDIDQSKAVLEGQTPTLIYTSGLQAALGNGLPDCITDGSAPDRDFAIQSCGSTPKTVVAGKMPDANGLRSVQRPDPTTGQNYEGTEVDTLTATLALNWDTSLGLFSAYTGFAGLDSTQLFDGQYDALPAGTYTNFSGDYTFTLPECGFADCSPTAQEINFNNRTRLFSQELRYATQWDGPVNITVGGLFWNEEVKQNEQSKSITPLISRQNFAFPGFPVPPGIPIQDTTAFPPAQLNLPGVFIPGDAIVERDTTSYSLYGLVDWDISETVSLALEGRWVSEKLDVSGSVCDTDATFALTGLGNPNACAQDYRGASSVGIANGNGTLAQGTYSLAVFNQKTDRFTDTFFAPKATLQWEPSDTQLLYGSVAQGVKPGGISTITAGAFFNPEENTFDKENLITYELGSKSTLFNGSVILNGAVFYQDYTDKQVGVTRFDAAAQTDVGGIENAGEAETYGFELETQWQVTDNLSLGAGYTYLQSEYTKFIVETQSGNVVARDLAAGGDGCSQIIDETPNSDTIGRCIVDLSGNDIEDVPTHSFVGNTRWEAPLLSTGMDYFADASFIYKSDRFIDETNAKELRAYWLIDLRAGLIGDRWEAILFVDNMFDDDTVKSAVDFGSIVDSTRQGFAPPSPPDGVIVSLPDPRVVGLRLNYRFGS